MQAIILYTEISEASTADDLDVLAQVEAVSKALVQLGVEPLLLPVSLDLQRMANRLKDLRPDFVFNLVESLNGSGRLLFLAPSVLDVLNLPSTGGSAHTLYITTNKILTKQQLAAAGIATPAWRLATSATDTPDFSPPYLIKPAWEDASVGIDEESLVFDAAHLSDILQKRTQTFGECLIEAYIPGREFNLSVLAAENSPEVLPPAEMLFRDYPPDKPRIVDYRAKWDEASFEYKNTIRTFEFPESDAALLDGLKDIAIKCWNLFECRGYARVDFRVDESGKPWVLEVNANPCISPDAGFVAAAERAGLSYRDIVERIVRDSINFKVKTHVPHPQNI